MYGWFWRRLPWRLRWKIAMALLLAAVVGGLLWFYVFPLLEPLVALDEFSPSVGR